MNRAHSLYLKSNFLTPILKADGSSATWKLHVGER